MYGEGTRTFWCVVNGSTPPFDISVKVDVNVNGLKKEEMACHDVAASSLVLWKVYYYCLLILIAGSTILPAKRPRSCGTSTYSLEAH